MQEIIDTGFQKMNKLGALKTPFLAIISFDTKQMHVHTLQEMDTENIYIHFPNFKSDLKKVDHKITLTKRAIPFTDYKNGFEKVYKNILYGNSFLCNFTCSSPIVIEASLQNIFAQAVAKYKIQFKQEWVCFSPETFIEIKNNCIHTYPMKGTIDASIPDAANSILTDKKETAEHYTIVDLLRNDLSQIAKNVCVKKFRYIEEIKTAHKNLLQVSSHVQGELENNWQESIGTILQKLLPAGSISGAPKKKTLEIIEEAENHERGFYTGVAVLYDGHTLDSCVLIRFIEKTANGHVYKSGGGITYQSDAATEYDELLDKIYIPTA